MLVAQGIGRTADQGKQAFASGFDMRAMLDVGARPIARGRPVSSLVEQRVKGLQYECLVLLRGGFDGHIDPPHVACYFRRSAAPPKKTLEKPMRKFTIDVRPTC